MSQLKISIIDRKRAISGIVHESYARMLVASLTAEPESIGELEQAIHRFVTPESDWPALHFLGRGEDIEPFGDGVLAVDLGTRTILARLRETQIGKMGRVTIETKDESDFGLIYNLSNDWRFATTADSFNGRRRRSPFASHRNRRSDTRHQLFGTPLCEFVVERAATAANPDSQNAVADIHAEWLTTPQDSLSSRTPREVMLEKLSFIDDDLQARSLQWAVSGFEPPPLDPECAAYRFAGYGTHSLVVHYDYFRFLYAAAARKRVRSAGELYDLGLRWLEQPQPELSGRRPAEILENERRRKNNTAAPGDLPLDDDCPACREMVAHFDSPIFWHVDCSAMELERFEFSPYLRREEWEEQMRLIGFTEAEIAGMKT
jgi:hypothetical protein